MTKPTTISGYIEAFPQAVQGRLQEIRRLCSDAAPAAHEQLKWGNPSYVHTDGVILFMFSGYKKHVNLAFTPSTRAAFDDELAEYQTGKGTVALPYDAVLPVDLLRRMVAYRIREHEIDGINWM